MNVIKFFKLLVLACTFDISWALYCYQCDSRTDLSCKEYLDSTDKLALRPKLCTENAAEYCIKTTGVWGGAVGTTRFCSSRDMFNQCQYVNYKDHDRIYRACIYTCRGDGCNFSPRVWNASFSSVAGFLFVLTVLVPRLLGY